MNNRLETIIDLKKYPIQDLNSLLMKKLIKKCKSDLDQFSCATIPNFVLPKSLKIMSTELEKQLDEVYMSKQSINAYLYSKDDSSLPKNHPKRIFMDRDNGYLNSDLFEKDMTITVESYIGEVDGKEGVKLEQQCLVGENGLELMSHHPLEDL